MRTLLLLLTGMLFLLPGAFADDGLIKVKSQYPVAETLDRFEQAVKEKGMTVFARIDHTENARGVDMTLTPTQVLIFGNPKVGTLLMQSNPTAGIDLPLKALAWQDADGNVWLAYNDPAWLVARHGIGDRAPLVEKMRAALGGFGAAASGNTKRSDP